MARTKVSISGIGQATSRILKLGREMESDIADVTEAYTRKMANESADAAPELTGNLKNSIVASPTKIKPTLWEFGSDLPYATRQEYEHKTKKGYMRNTIASNRDSYIGAIERIAKGN